MSDIRCSREGIKCDGCPIMDKCEHIEATEEIDPYVFYKQGRADREQELEKAFKKLYGSECSWSEVLLLADKQ